MEGHNLLSDKVHTLILLNLKTPSLTEEVFVYQSVVEKGAVPFRSLEPMPRPLPVARPWEKNFLKEIYFQFIIRSWWQLLVTEKELKLKSQIIFHLKGLLDPANLEISV